MLDNLVEILKQYWELACRRQWKNWELLTIAAAVTVLLLLIIAMRWLRNKHGNRKNVRMNADWSEITDYERLKFFQQEIIKRDYAGARLEREVSELTADNEQLHDELEKARTALDRARQKIAELTVTNELLQNEAGQTNELPEKEIIQLKAVNERLEHEAEESKEAIECSRQEITVLTAANEQLREEMKELTVANEKLRKELEESEKGRVHFEPEVTELNAGGEQHDHAVTAHNGAASEDADDVDEIGVSKLTWSVIEKMVPFHVTEPNEKNPARQLRELAHEVLDLNVQKGITDVSDAKKEAILQACDYLEVDNAVMAVDALQRFVDSVQAQQSDNGEILQKQEAEELITAARDIIDLLKTR